MVREVEIRLVETDGAEVGVVGREDFPDGVARRYVLVEVTRHDDEARTELLRNEAGHRCSHPEPSCNVVGRRLPTIQRQSAKFSLI